MPARSPLALAVSVGSTVVPLSVVPGTRSKRARNVQPLAPGGGLAQVYPVKSVWLVRNVAGFAASAAAWDWLFTSHQYKSTMPPFPFAPVEFRLLTFVP